MSVKLMSIVYEAHFRDVVFTRKGRKKATGQEYTKQITVLAPNLKSVCLALADHANDEGEGAYPSIWKLEWKTELSRPTVIACLTAMKHEGIIARVGVSKFDTCNYTINKEKLVEMTTWERQKREKKASKAALPSEAALLGVVKPLSEGSKAALPEPSINHPLTSGAETKTAPLKPQKKGDIMDGILFYAGLAQQNDNQLKTRVQDYPQDCQQPLLWFVEVFELMPSAIPAKPSRESKGGVYAQWINEIREMSNVLEGFGKSAIQAAKNQCGGLSISHPSAIMWALPAEVGKLAANTRRAATVNAVPEWVKGIQL